LEWTVFTLLEWTVFTPYAKVNKMLGSRKKIYLENYEKLPFFKKKNTWCERQGDDKTQEWH